ncbi:MAG: dienelactone hydrolase family protein [Clostridia bacterium]|nr:dienelactone hydrolase family protein [Clostridia bacterium]
MIDGSSFLTPVSLWKDFDNSQPLQPSKISEVKYDNFVYAEYYFSGRKTESGKVRIYSIFVTPDDGGNGNFILYVPQIAEKMSYQSVNEYVKLGYSVLAVDIYGKREGAENFTVYPEDIYYANYDYRGRRMDFVDENARKTCWYEWVAVCKYGLAFLRSMDASAKIGVVGVKVGADIAWQLAATEDKLDCAVMMFGAGWNAYLGIPKYSDRDIIMDEERRRYIAAVDAHAYAQYVKCPVLFLTSTNSQAFDFDRANDTLSRISDGIPCVFNFAPTYNVFLDGYCKTDSELFLGKYLRGDDVDFPEKPTLDSFQDGNYIKFELNFDKPSEVKECKVFVNEGVIEPALRNWMRCDQKDDGDIKKGKLTFEYVVGGNPKIFFAFAVVRYKDGSSLSSKLICKKTDGVIPKRANLLYSSLNGLDGITFYDINADGKKDVFVQTDDFIRLVKGAENIYGAYSKYGLISFKFNEPGCKLDENSIVKLDVFASEFCVLKLILMTKTDGGTKEFSYSQEISAGASWRNLTVFISDFKSDEGMIVRDFDSIYALRIESEGKYAVNNILLI